MALYIVDGHALVYRAYYAFINRPLVNSKGEETSAVFGFASTILSLLKKFNPDYLLVAFDSPEKTFRHQAFVDYKSNRKEMPESLISQMSGIQEFLDAMSIMSFSLPGYEADDIIATIATRMQSKVPVRIISGDKDLYQLINERTHVLRPAKAGQFEEEVDERALMEKTGLEARQFGDYLALMGDASDNVPGVRGVGEKTALKLIKEFNDLDRLYAGIQTIKPPSLQKKLIEGRESAFMSRSLVELERRVPMEVTLGDLAAKDPDMQKLEVLLGNLEFNKMLDSVKKKTGTPGPNASAYKQVGSEDALAELAGALSGVKEFAVDVEASDIDSMKAVLAGISIAWIPGEAYYVPVASMIVDDKPALDLAGEAHGLQIETVRNLLAPVFKNPAVRKIGHHIKYDAIVLANAGMPLEGIAFDTMLASYSLNPSRRSHGLDSLVSEFLRHEMIPFKSLFDSRSKKKDIRRVDLEKVCEYACEDADMTLRLKKIFEPLINSSQVEKLFFEVEMPLSAVLTEMEQSGVKIDTGRLSALSVEIEGKLETIQKAVFDEAGEKFNINSTQKLSEILFGKLGLKPVRKTKTGFSTDMDVLKTLADEHELPKLLLEYRTLSKLKNTYVDALPALINPATRRIHTSYNQAVTHTGRLSSSNPNLQNIPIRTPMGRRIRQAFTAGGKDWILLDADYSQVELRILAHLSRDVELIKAFEEDGDVHSRTAALIHHISPQEVTPDMRSRAKTVNFGIIYGMGPRGLAQALKMDFKEARDFIDDYFECYPGVKRFIDSTIRRAREEKAISTLMGRIRQLPDIDSADNRTRAFAERVAVNTPVQGTAADIIKAAMVAIASEFKRRNLRARMILQVHDELLFDLPLDELEEVRKLIINMMEGAIELDVPLKVDTGIGADWLEAHG